MDQLVTTRISMVGLSAKDNEAIVVPFEASILRELQGSLYMRTEVYWAEHYPVRFADPAKRMGFVFAARESAL